MPADVAPTTSSPSRAPVWTAGDWGRAALMFATLLVVYFPALRGEFLWDDASHVTRPELRSLAGLARIWKELGATQQYYPVLHSAFWLEHRLWGDATLGYHLVNLALHAVAACLVVVMLRRLGVQEMGPSTSLRTFGSGGAEWFAAAVFALHPVAVESVAWISEQKNTLSLVCYLAAALAYFRFDERRTARSYALATLWFTLALLSKTVTATLPAVLLVILWWRRGGLAWRRDIVPLLPWLTLGVTAGLFTAWVERRFVGAEGAAFDLTFLDRWSVAGRAIWFYAGKLVWPTELAFIYPRWDLASGGVGQLWLLPAAVAVAAAFEWRKRRGALAGWLIFCGSLFPVLGFFNAYPFRFSFVADHFQYLASLGLIVPAAAGATLLVGAAPRAWRYGLGAIVLGLLGTLSWRQTREYRDGFTLYGATVAKNPACWLAENNLGVALRQRGEIAAAIVHLSRAVELEPTLPESHNNLGIALAMAGRPAEAETHYGQALKLAPGYAKAHNNLGNLLLRAGRVDEAADHFTSALRANPNFAEALAGMGQVWQQRGRSADAVACYQRAVELQPDFAEAHYGLAVALRGAGRNAEARPHYETARRLNPRLPEIAW